MLFKGTAKLQFLFIYVQGASTPLLHLSLHYFVCLTCQERCQVGAGYFHLPSDSIRTVNYSANKIATICNTEDVSVFHFKMFIAVVKKVVDVRVTDQSIELSHFSFYNVSEFARINL